MGPPLRTMRQLPSPRLRPFHQPALQLCLQPAPAQPAGGGDPCWWLHGRRRAIGWASRLTAGQHPPPWHFTGSRPLKACGSCRRIPKLQLSLAAARWSHPKRWSTAQSIEYSLQGYPQLYSPFQHTAVRLRLLCSVRAAGIAHDINEPFHRPPYVSLRQRRTQPLHFSAWGAVQAFLQHSGPLRPHFALRCLGAPRL